MELGKSTRGHKPVRRAPRVCRSLMHFQIVYYFPKFLNIPKQTEDTFVELLESVYLPYHIPTPFSGLWSVSKDFPYVFLWCYSLNNSSFNINGRT